MPRIAPWLIGLVLLCGCREEARERLRDPAPPPPPAAAKGAALPRELVKPAPAKQSPPPPAAAAPAETSAETKAAAPAKTPTPAPVTLVPPGGAAASAPAANGSGTSPAAASAAASSAAEWPRFHGPLGNNKSPDTGLLREWPADGPRLVWTAEGMGVGYASVAIARGLIYTAGNLDEKTTVIALDMDGKPVWKAPAGPAWTKSYPGARSTPTVDGDRLYYETPLGDLVCLDARTGKPLWNRNILKEYDGENITWALAESPIVDGDRLICCPGGQKASVVALNKMTGAPIWAAKPTEDRASYATPAVVEHAGLRIVLAMSSKALLGVAADGGALLFRHEHVTQYDVNATTPLYSDGRIFVTSGYGTGSQMLDLKVDGQKAAVTQAWKSKDLDNHHGGVLLHEGHILGSSMKGKWICLDWKSGETRYSERGVGKGSLTFADGMFYCLSEKRDVGLVPATPKEHKVVCQFKTPSGGDGPSWAHPVVAGGRLYIRHADKLFVYDVRGK